MQTCLDEPNSNVIGFQSASGGLLAVDLALLQVTWYVFPLFTYLYLQFFHRIRY